jgi:oligopeptide transport system substrate-binding protein
MQRGHALKWLAVLTLGLGLVAAGCGGDGDDGGGAATDTVAPAAEQVITINWGAEPPSLDPGLASDTTSAAILLNIMDPLILLDDNNKPLPSLAESWEISEDGKPGPALTRLHLSLPFVASGG